MRNLMMWQVDGSLSVITRTSSEPSPGESKPTAGRVTVTPIQGSWGREVALFPLGDTDIWYEYQGRTCGSLLRIRDVSTLRRVKGNDNDLVFKH